MDIITTIPFCNAQGQGPGVTKYVYLVFSKLKKKNHRIQSTLKKSSFEISCFFLVLNFNILRFLPKYFVFFYFHLESNFVIVSIGVW